MLNKIRKNLTALAVLMALVAVPLAVIPATHAFAQAAGGTAAPLNLNDKLKCGSNISISDPNTCTATTSGSTNFTAIVTDIINIFSIVIGVVSVIMIIFGGFRYVTSGGDSGKVGDAKNTILYAIIGLVVVGAAQFIVQFVLDKVSTVGA